MRSRRWLPLSLLGLTLLLSPLAAQPQPEPKKAGLRLDHYGDPLPEHALLRIGTARLRREDAEHAMALTPDGRQFVRIDRAANIMDRAASIQVWDITSGRQTSVFGCPNNGPAAISADGSLVALIESSEVCRLYDSATGQKVQVLSGPWTDSNVLCLSPNNKLLACAAVSGNITPA